MKNLFICVLFILAILLNAESFKGEVVYVVDGDTIDVLNNNTKIRVRFYGIDCRERGESGYQEAKDFITAALLNKQVEILVMSKPDRWGRTIGIVNYKNINVNAYLVKLGLAWVYKKYCNSYYEEKWLILQKQAQEYKLGIWED